MTYVLGIDPGTGGALAVYDTVTRDVVGEIQDVPVWFQTVGKRKRKRVDTLALADMMDTFVLMGVELIVIEAVGGYGGQSTIGAFAFGYTVGVIYMASFYSGIAMDSVPPNTWKPAMNVPGKQKADDTAILQRANEVFPNARHQFTTARGGKRVDRAEAALIAKYGGDFILPHAPVKTDLERRLGYRHAETGA